MLKRQQIKVSGNLHWLFEFCMTFVSASHAIQRQISQAAEEGYSVSDNQRDIRHSRLKVKLSKMTEILRKVEVDFPQLFGGHFRQ